jgi:hypothetical protein
MAYFFNFDVEIPETLHRLFQMQSSFLIILSTKFLKTLNRMFQKLSREILLEFFSRLAVKDNMYTTPDSKNKLNNL